jgi:hypothetical protein
MSLSEVKGKMSKLQLILIEDKAIMRKSKDWLARNQDNVSNWGDMCIPGLLFQ